MDKQKSWNHEIDFHCTFGVWPFRKSLDIHPSGFVWCGELIPLRSITRVRWGYDQVRGGVFPKRVGVATFGTADREFTIRTKQKDFYDILTNKYWRALGRRLLSSMFDTLKRGERIVFTDELAVEDKGIIVRKKQMFGSAPEASYIWEDIGWAVVNGTLCFVPLSEPDNILAGASFIWSDNLHVLDVALSMLGQSEDKRRLSACASMQD
ncbi:MAG: hypothetical protein Q4F74_00770 [Synergistaceae bacterium]|nr:hypothetical protein [Synergistaceae bacterium]